MNKFFITTAIPYINARPHIGHIQEFLLTRQLVRQLQNQGQKVLWQSGTDDNSLKNLETAQKLGIPLAEYLNSQIGEFQKLFNGLNLKPDYLVHTSGTKHKETVTQFIQSLHKEDLYLKTYQGHYCGGCEDFIKDHELIDGVCPDHKTIPKLIQEDNIFFKLSKYQDQIKVAIKSGKVKIYPKWREKEILSFLEGGLQDISVSRPVDSTNLGVDFPDQEGHKVYVWIDALVNYLTGIDYFKGGQEIWDGSYKIHVIGKNIWKFHALYWLGLLISAGIELPNEILIHGFLTVDGEKISKSLGNGGNLEKLLTTWTSNEIGSFLLGRNNYTVDSDFSEAELSRFYLQELVGQVANLFPRVWTIATKVGFTLTRTPTELEGDFRDLHTSYGELLTLAQDLNKRINDSKVWTLDLQEAKEHLEAYNRDLNRLADLLSIWFPELEKKINNSFTEKVILLPKKTII